MWVIRFWIAIDGRKNKNEDIASFKKRNALDERPIVALLAGSRVQELQNVLPEMLAMIDHYPDYQFVVAGAPSFTEADYKPFVGAKDVKIVFNETYELLQQAQGAFGYFGNGYFGNGIVGLSADSVLQDVGEQVDYQAGEKIYHQSGTCVVGKPDNR